MILYRVLLTLVWPILALAFLIRVLRGQERWRDLAERLGVGQPRAVPNTLWVHAASNGELASAKPILIGLVARHPALNLLITTNTVTGRALANRWELSRTSTRLAPLDTWWACPKVRTHITLESELWPNRIRRLPTAVLGARLSQGTARGWSKIPGLATRIFPKLTTIIPQDAASAQRFADLGVATANITAPAQLKALYLPPDRPVPDDIQAAFKPARTWLAASTHEGEDAQVIEAHKLLIQNHPDLRLILAPRHPARGDDVAALIADAGLSAWRRSEGIMPPETSILLADTMGEMDYWYRSAAITFVGGSLAPKGGHTPFEPAFHGSAIVHGPDTKNFADSYAALAPNGATQVTDAHTLAAKIARLLDPATHQAQTTAARTTLQDQPSARDILQTLTAALDLSNSTR